MAALLKEDSHFCGGSLIANQWILTSGHCFRNLEAEECSKLHGDCRGWTLTAEQEKEIKENVKNKITVSLKQPSITYCLFHVSM